MAIYSGDLVSIIGYLEVSSSSDLRLGYIAMLLVFSSSGIGLCLAIYILEYGPFRLSIPMSKTVSLS